MKSRFNKAALLVASFSASLCSFGITEALVVSPPIGNEGIPISSPDAVDYQLNQNNQLARSRHRNLRIRSTTQADISDIAHILATSLQDQATEGGLMGGFKAQIALLKTKSGVESLLQSRVHAMETARMVQFPHLEYNPAQISEADGLRYVWSNHDSFRKRIEKAATLSNEPHIWKHHNFACAPESFGWLQHKMLTAVDATSGEIVGFCEVAMLGKPEGVLDGNADHSHNYAPTIMNLATCPKHRRKGVATRLMHSASRFVQSEWKSSTELALYVEQDNKGAIALYQNLGFGSPQTVERNDSYQFYMAKPLAVPSYV